MSELALQHERVIAARSRLGFPTTPVKRIPRAMLNKPRAVRPAPPPPEVEKPVKRLVAEQMSPRAPQWVRIIHEVAVKHNIDVASLLNDGRFLHIVKARNEAFWRMRNEIKINGQRMSFPMIGEKFGKDHTTVMHGVRKHASELPPLSTLPTSTGTNEDLDLWKALARRADAVQPRI